MTQTCQPMPHPLTQQPPLSISAIFNQQAITQNQDYATKLQSIKMEINALKAMISNAVAQFKTAITSVTAPWPQFSDMDTDVADSKANYNNNPKSADLGALIQDLKYKITTIITEMRAMFAQQLLLVSNNKRPSSAVT